MYTYIVHMSVFSKVYELPVWLARPLFYNAEVYFSITKQERGTGLASQTNEWPAIPFTADFTLGWSQWL